LTKKKLRNIKIIKQKKDIKHKTAENNRK
jgi:hypothetical protein